MGFNKKEDRRLKGKIRRLIRETFLKGKDGN